MKYDKSKLIYRVYRPGCPIHLRLRVSVDSSKTTVWWLRTCLIGPTVLPGHCLLSSTLERYTPHAAPRDLRNHGKNSSLHGSKSQYDNLMHHAVQQSNFQTLTAVLWESAGFAFPASVYAQLPAWLSSYGRHARKLTESRVYTNAIAEQVESIVHCRRRRFSLPEK